MYKAIGPPVINKFIRLARYLYRLHIRRDPFLLEVRRWFRDRGDETLRLDYPLDAKSLVVDVGGYRGDFADAIHKRFGCRVVIFEPVPAFFSHCEKRFSGIKNIQVVDCGLGGEDGVLPIDVADDGSSFFGSGAATSGAFAKVRKADTVLSELGIDYIDLIKINIEGGEYDLLRVLIESGWIDRIRYVQVQFHNFIPDAVVLRNALRKQLAKTHREMWNYEFVWECWEPRQ
jgi:FkbM family methyltransferase